MVLKDTPLCYVSWSTDTADREDPEYYHPDLVKVEDVLARSGAIQLGHLADFVCRSVDPSRNEGTFRYIDIASINILTGDVQPVEMAVFEAPSRARKLVRRGDVIVSTVRPARNAVACIEEELDGCVCSTGFAVLRPRTLHPFALYGFLKSKHFIAQAIRRCTATMYPVVAEEELKTVLVPARYVQQCDLVVDALQEATSYRNMFQEQLKAVQGKVEELMNEPG